MQLLSHASVKIILNGHMITGMSSDEPSYEWEFEDAAEIETGTDAGMYGVSKPSVGGIFTIKLAPTSPSAQWCMQQETLRSNAVLQGTTLRVYEGSFSDQATGVSWGMTGGVILMFPKTRVAGVAYEAKLQFEKITSQVDGGVFRPPFTSE